MIKIEFEFFLQSTTHPLEIDVGWILDTLGSNWIRFGNLSLQYKKDFRASPICKASDAEHVKIIVGSVFRCMGSDLNLVGRAMDD